MRLLKKLFRKIDCRPELMVFLACALVTSTAFAENDCANCIPSKTKHATRELSSLPIREIASLAGEYDFSSVSKLPILERPTAAAINDMAPNHPLLQKMNIDRGNFYRARHLLPQKFRIADGTKFQAVIDDTILKMVSTEAGKQAVCAFAVDRAQDIEMYLQVSASAAGKIRVSCAGRKYPDAVVHRLRVMREINPPFFPVPLVPEKKFVFIFSESGKSQIEGYTTKSNTTYLVLSAENRDPASISRLISHEIAMSYDQLARFGYLANVSTLEDLGVNLAFGLPNGETVFVPPANNKELERVKCAFRDPAIRYAANAQRAFKFEDAVRTELGDQANAAAGGSCGEVLAKNSVLLQAMARTVSWDTGWYQAQCGLAKDPSARLKQILARIKTVESTELPCKDPKFCGGKRSMKLCDLLLNPRIGPFAADLDGGGPRPTMGGGSGEYIDSDQDAILRLLNGGSISADEEKRLGQSLNFPNADELLHEDMQERRKP